MRPPGADRGERLHAGAGRSGPLPRRAHPAGAEARARADRPRPPGLALLRALCHPDERAPPVRPEPRHPARLCPGPAGRRGGRGGGAGPRLPGRPGRPAHRRGGGGGVNDNFY